MNIRQFELAQGKDNNQAFGDRLYSWWSDVRDFLHGLRVAWVSVASVAIGLLLFLYTPQAQDLFLEAKGNVFETVRFWSIFYVLVIAAWALPVFISARWILAYFEEDANGPPDVVPIRTWVRRLIPPLVATSCFVAVLAGQYMATSNALTIIEPLKEQQNSRSASRIQELDDMKQTDRYVIRSCGNNRGTFIESVCNIGVRQDLIARHIGRLIYFIFGYHNLALALPALLAILFIWFKLAKPSGREPTSTHRIIKRIVLVAAASASVLVLAWWAFTYLINFEKYLSNLPPLYFSQTIFNTLFWGPPSSYLENALTPHFKIVLLIAFALILAIIWLAWREWDRLLWWFGSLFVVFIALLVLYSFYDAMRLESEADFSLLHLLLLPSVTILAAFIAWYVLRPSAEERVTLLGQVLLRAVNHSGPVDEAGVFKKFVNPIFSASLMLSGAIVMIFVFVHPFHITPWVHRALLLPVVLGLSVPILTYITRWSTTYRFPSLLVIALAIAALNVYAGETSQVRIVAEQSERYSLSDSVRRWADLNNCTLETPSLCPNPIVIVASGGASRSAFHVAGVIGDILDGSILALRHQYLKGFAVTADGSRLITAGAGLRGRHTGDGLRIWNLETGKVDKTLDLRSRIDKRVAISADGNRVVFVDLGGLDPRIRKTSKWVRVWDPNSNKLIQSLNVLGSIQSVAITADGNQVVFVESGDLDPRNGKTPNWVRVWDLKLNKISQGPDIGDDVQEVIVAADAKRVVVQHRKARTVHVWDSKGGEKPTVLSHDKTISSVAVTPDGRRVVTADLNEVRVWDLETSNKPMTILPELNSSVAVSANGNQVVTEVGTDTGHDKLNVWDLNDTETTPLNLAGIGSIRRFLVTADGSRLITNGYNDTVMVYVRDGRNFVRARAKQIEDYRNIAKRIFAISAVSGGSLGAAVTYAALADAQLSERDGKQVSAPPCSEGSISDPDWFGSKNRHFLRSDYSALNERKPNISWKDCLQLLVSGDFISPVFVSLVSNDPFPFKIRGTRGEILEQAWEERYARLTGQDSGLGLATKGDGDSTLAKSMASLRRSVLEADESSNWLPVLLLNGTSVATGRRIIASDINTFRSGKRGVNEYRFFRDAYDLHELMQRGTFKDESTPVDPKKGENCQNCRVRLSTAVTMSARFPIISPSGAISNVEDDLVDHIVDGGYYENFGATTAMQLIKELQETYKLESSVILIDNEPTKSAIKCAKADKADKVDKADKADIGYPDQTSAPWFPIFFDPLDAFFEARTARGNDSAIQLCTAANLKGKDNFIHFHVKEDRFREEKPVPMSWWLSKRVQKYLDEQLQNDSNVQAISKVVEWLRPVTPVRDCVSYSGMRFVSAMEMSEYEKYLIQQMRFSDTAKLLITPAFPHDIKGLVAPSRKPYNLRAFVGPESWAFEISDRLGNRRTIASGLPRRSVRFIVDPRNEEATSAGGGPRLYKEWRLESTADLGGPVGENKERAQARLILHGHGNKCTYAEDFTRWTLQVWSPDVRFTLVGKLKQPN